jgi:hypothetical protein
VESGRKVERRLKKRKGKRETGTGMCSMYPEICQRLCNLNGLVVQLALGLLEHGACLLEGVFG